MSDAPRRRCPVCEQVMQAAVCPEDRMATLLVDVPVHDAPPPQVGEVLGDRYEVREPIGSGGYGRVYRAKHLGTGQDIALKVLRVPPDEDGAFAVQRFFLEARATSGLTHPNTVRVFDFGQDDLGRVFIAMELLAGRTLREELRVRKTRGTRFTELEVAQIGVAITRSLGEAHERGLVHRDLKPDNVFLHRVAGDDPIVKVLDFGIAKLGSAGHHTLSSDTSVPGTPAYMAPEHAFNQDVDGRTDLYALGVVLYQLLTQALPYQAPSDPQTLYMHAYEAVPDPAAKADVSAPLSAVVVRAMQKAPDARFADARAMRDALSEAIDGSLASGRSRAIVPAAAPASTPSPGATGLAGGSRSASAPLVASAPLAEPGLAHAPPDGAPTAETTPLSAEVTGRASSGRGVAGVIGGAVLLALVGGLLWFALAGPGSRGAASDTTSARPAAPSSAAPAGGSAASTGAGAETPVAPAADPAPSAAPSPAADDADGHASPAEDVAEPAAAPPPRATKRRRAKRAPRRRARPAKPPKAPEAVSEPKEDVLQMRLEELLERPE